MCLIIILTELTCPANTEKMIVNSTTMAAICKYQGIAEKNDFSSRKNNLTLCLLVTLSITQ